MEKSTSSSKNISNLLLNKNSSPLLLTTPTIPKKIMYHQCPTVVDDPVPSDQQVPLPIIDNGLSKPNITAIIRECLLKQFSEEEIRENYMETHKTRYIHTGFLLDTGLLEVVLQNIKDKLPPSDHSVVRKVTTNYINYVMKIR